MLRLVAACSASSLAGPGLGCLARPRPIGKPSGGRHGCVVDVDPSFASMIFEWMAAPGAERQPLLEHPALDALVRHQHLTGNTAATPGTVLDSILLGIVNVLGGRAVLERWNGHEMELEAHAAAALDFLPAGTQFDGTLFLVAGYDIGIAAPPDIALNVAYLHFVENPDELGYYATHEAHHVGFLSHRPFPDLDGLDDPFRLADAIRFFTQMEGMAVHSVSQRRLAAGALGDDADYLIYHDDTEAARVMNRYREVVGQLEGREVLWPFEVGEILEAMSSGERLWYRFGALVAAEIERSRGREALIDTIRAPARFDAVAEELLGTRV